MRRLAHIGGNQHVYDFLNQDKPHTIPGNPACRRQLDQLGLFEEQAVQHHKTARELQRQQARQLKEEEECRALEARDLQQQQLLVQPLHLHMKAQEEAAVSQVRRRTADGLNCWVACIVTDCMRMHDMQAAESEASEEEKERDDGSPVYVTSQPEYEKAKNMM
jgi:hypothetical protein